MDTMSTINFHGASGSISHPYKKFMRSFPFGSPVAASWSSNVPLKSRHARRRRVLDLEPGLRPPRLVGAIARLRTVPSSPSFASVAEHDLAVAIEVFGETNAIWSGQEFARRGAALVELRAPGVPPPRVVRDPDACDLNRLAGGESARCCSSRTGPHPQRRAGQISGSETQIGTRMLAKTAT
jgi:hypothetical protein